MYTFLLILAFLAVVLSPIALDRYLTIKEARLTRRARRDLLARYRKSPRIAWALHSAAPQPWFETGKDLSL